MNKEVPTLTIEQAAAVARRSTHTHRVLIGLTEQGSPIWSWLGNIIVATGERRRPA